MLDIMVSNPPVIAVVGLSIVAYVGSTTASKDVELPPAV